MPVASFWGHLQSFLPPSLLSLPLTCARVLDFLVVRFFDQVSFLYKCLWKGFKGGLLCICIWPLPKFIFWKGLKSVSDPLPSPRKILSCVGSLANPLPPQFHEQSVSLNVPMVLPNAPTCCTVSFDNDTLIQLFKTFIPMMPPNTRTCTVIQFRVKYFTWNSVTLQIEKNYDDNTFILMQLQSSSALFWKSALE